MKEWFIKWGYAEGVFEKEIKKAFLNKTKKSKKTLNFMDPWTDGVQMLQGYRATSRRQFTFN